MLISSKGECIWVPIGFSEKIQEHARNKTWSLVMVPKPGQEPSSVFENDSNPA